MTHEKLLLPMSVTEQYGVAVLHCRRCRVDWAKVDGVERRITNFGLTGLTYGGELMDCDEESVRQVLEL